MWTIMVLQKILLVATVLAIIAGANGDCGNNPLYTSLIVRGAKVDPGHWPWIAGLFYQDDFKLTFMCGATLVSKDTVVTAAHCVNSNGRTYPPNTLVVKFGRHEIFNWEEKKTVQTRHASEVIIHRSYLQSRAKGADIAVIKLKSAVNITDNVSPVCTWKPENGHSLVAGSLGIVVGWGMDEKYSTTETPRLTRLPLVSRQTCLDSHPDFKSFVYDYQFCAGNRDGTGPCHGDSGNGMFILKNLPNKRRRWVMIGMVSRSLIVNETGLCDLQNYIVFTDMKKIAPWISEHTMVPKHPISSSGVPGSSSGHTHSIYPWHNVHIPAFPGTYTGTPNYYPPRTLVDDLDIPAFPGTYSGTPNYPPRTLVDDLDIPAFPGTTGESSYPSSSSGYPNSYSGFQGNYPSSYSGFQGNYPSSYTGKSDDRYYPSSSSGFQGNYPSSSSGYPSSYSGFQGNYPSSYTGKSDDRYYPSSSSGFQGNYPSSYSGVSDFFKKFTHCCGGF